MKIIRVYYSDGYRWQLREEAVFETGILGREILTKWIRLDRTGKLTLAEGYATDGITGITGKPWAKLFERPWLRRGSFGHDGLYQLMRLGLLPGGYRAKADALLNAWSSQDGAWQWQANLVEKIVKGLAASAVLPSAERRILSAP